MGAHLLHSTVLFYFVYQQALTWLTLLAPKYISKPSISLHLHHCHVYLNHYKVLPRHSMSSRIWLHYSPRPIYYPRKQPLNCSAGTNKSHCHYKPCTWPLSSFFSFHSLLLTISSLSALLLVSQNIPDTFCLQGQNTFFSLFWLSWYSASILYYTWLVMKTGNTSHYPLGSDSTSCPYPLPYLSILPLSWNVLNLHTLK